MGIRNCKSAVPDHLSCVFIQIKPDGAFEVVASGGCTGTCSRPGGGLIGIALAVVPSGSCGGLLELLLGVVFAVVVVLVQVGTAVVVVQVVL